MIIFFSFFLISNILRPIVKYLVIYCHILKGIFYSRFIQTLTALHRWLWPVRSNLSLHLDQGRPASTSTSTETWSPHTTSLHPTCSILRRLKHREEDFWFKPELPVKRHFFSNQSKLVILLFNCLGRFKDKHMNIKSKFLNISKFIQNSVHIEYGIEIRYRT